MTEQSRREHIIDAANDLFHKQGYNKTSIADIANQLGITKGNLQYHFRSKDDLLAAIINARMENMANALQRFEKENADPKERLKRIVQMVQDEQEGLISYGCSIGSINVELGKGQRPLQQLSLQMFEQQKEWIEQAFTELGKENAKTLSMHMLSMIQGAVLMSYAYNDGKVLQKECGFIKQWIDEIV
ncbi:MAG: TetR/AcrR family transcriptional regulator [Gammaproteobacteria bacterium]